MVTTQHGYRGPMTGTSLFTPLVRPDAGTARLNADVQLYCGEAAGELPGFRTRCGLARCLHVPGSEGAGCTGTGLGEDNPLSLRREGVFILQGRAMT